MALQIGEGVAYVRNKRWTASSQLDTAEMSAVFCPGELRR